MLLHACCGPCSIMPSRLLAQEGFDIDILYANSNIAPRAEYDRRLDTLRAFVDAENAATAEGAGDSAGSGTQAESSQTESGQTEATPMRVLEGAYDPASWEATAGEIGEAIAIDLSARMDAATVPDLLDDGRRIDRCRACYRLRLEEAARVAVEGGYDVLSTTLAVSPYQFTDVIREELERAAANAGIRAHFEDFRPYYDDATRISRELGMYRQDYCGCRFSVAEGAATRAWVRKQQADRKRARQEARAAETAAAEQARAAKKRDRAAYAEKQARKHAALKALREQAAAERATAERAANDPNAPAD